MIFLTRNHFCSVRTPSVNNKRSLSKGVDNLDDSIFFKFLLLTIPGNNYCVNSVSLHYHVYNIIHLIKNIVFAA